MIDLIKELEALKKLKEELGPRHINRSVFHSQDSTIMFLAKLMRTFLDTRFCCSLRKVHSDKDGYEILDFWIGYFDRDIVSDRALFSEFALLLPPGKYHHNKEDLENLFQKVREFIDTYVSECEKNLPLCYL